MTFPTGRLRARAYTGYIANNTKIWCSIYKQNGDVPTYNNTLHFIYCIWMVCFAWLNTTRYISLKTNNNKKSTIKNIIDCVEHYGMEWKNEQLGKKILYLQIHILTYRKQVMQSMLNSSFFFFKKKIMFDGMSTLKKQLINIHSSVILLSIKFTKRKQRKKNQRRRKN